MRTLAHAGMTMIVVTHKLKLAAEVANRVIFTGAGVVVEEGGVQAFSPTHRVTGRARVCGCSRAHKPLAQYRRRLAWLVLGGGRALERHTFYVRAHL